MTSGSSLHNFGGAAEEAKKVGGWLPRVLRIAQRSFISHGQFTGANAVLLEIQEIQDVKGLLRQNDFRQVIYGYSHDSMAMTVVGLCSLFARASGKNSAGQGVVSLQGVYHRLKAPEVADAFLNLWEESKDPSLLAVLRRTRATAAEWVDEFLEAYQKLDWGQRGGSISRLQHLRNHGIAHLLERPMSESITAEELRKLMEQLAEMTAPLCQLNLANWEWASMADSHEMHLRGLRYWRSAMPQEFRQYIK